VTRHEITVADLGLDDVPIVVSLWLVEPGGKATEGEPAVELLAGCATVDLPAPADGRLEALVEEGDEVRVGDRVAVIVEA